MCFPFRIRSLLCHWHSVSCPKESSRWWFELYFSGSPMARQYCPSRRFEWLILGFLNRAKQPVQCEFRHNRNSLILQRPKTTIDTSVTGIILTSYFPVAAIDLQKPFRFQSHCTCHRTPWLVLVCSSTSSWATKTSRLEVQPKLNGPAFTLRLHFTCNQLCSREQPLDSNQNGGYIHCWSLLIYTYSNSYGSMWELSNFWRYIHLEILEPANASERDVVFENRNLQPSFDYCLVWVCIGMIWPQSLRFGDS